MVAGRTRDRRGRRRRSRRHSPMGWRSRASGRVGRAGRLRSSRRDRAGPAGRSGLHAFFPRPTPGRGGRRLLRIARLPRARASRVVVADHVRVLAAVDGLAVPVRGRVPVVGVPVLARSGGGLPARRPTPLVAVPASGAAWTSWATRAGWANLPPGRRSGKAARGRIANRAALLPVRRWVAGGCRRTLAGAGLARLAVPSVRPRLPLRVIGVRRSWPAELTRLTLRTIGTWRPLHAVRARLALRAELTLRVVRARLPLRAERAGLALRAELARRP